MQDLQFIREIIRKTYVQEGHEGVAKLKVKYPEYFNTEKNLANRTFMLQPKLSAEGNSYIPGKFVVSREKATAITNG